MDEQQSVLIVDPSEETREVLQTALERRGMRIFSAARIGSGLEMARRHHPDLIVLDLELDESSPEHLSTPFAEQADADNASFVVLGNIRRRNSCLPNAEFVAKPYHYAPLIRKIEELLGRCTMGEPGPCRRCS